MIDNFFPQNAWSVKIFRCWNLPPALPVTFIFVMWSAGSRLTWHDFFLITYHQKYVSRYLYKTSVVGIPIFKLLQCSCVQQGCCLQFSIPILLPIHLKLLTWARYCISPVTIIQQWHNEPSGNWPPPNSEYKQTPILHLWIQLSMDPLIQGHMHARTHAHPCPLT